MNTIILLFPPTPDKTDTPTKNTKLLIREERESVLRERERGGQSERGNGNGNGAQETLLNCAEADQTSLQRKCPLLHGFITILPPSPSFLIHSLWHNLLSHISVIGKKKKREGNWAFKPFSSSFQSSLPNEAIYEKEKSRVTVIRIHPPSGNSVNIPSSFPLLFHFETCDFFLYFFSANLDVVTLRSDRWFWSVGDLTVGFCYQWPKQLNAPLEEVDPEIANIIELEKARQWKVIFLQIFFFNIHVCLNTFRL